VGGDAYTLALAHREDGRYVVDVVRGQRGPFDPSAVTAEYAALCKEYRVLTVTGDRFGAEWVAASWRSCGVSYVPSERTASELYIECLPLWTRAQVSIPNHPVLLRELRLLERSPTRLGRELVTHPRNAHDDHANVCCGALACLASYLGASAYSEALGRASDDDALPADVEAWQEAERQKRHAALLERYGQSICPTPLDLVPAHLRPAFEAAKASARRARVVSIGGAHGQV
jgi:hypothetical protein